MKDLKQLVENIINYTIRWSITEDEWYWNIAYIRKSNNSENGQITWEEFQVAIREEILFDLIFNNGLSIKNQMENDLCYGEEKIFTEESIKLENEIKNL